MNTNYSNNVEGALKLINVNGSLYQLGKDAGNTEGGIAKLFNNFETYAASTDGAFNAKVVYDEIDALKTAIGSDSATSIADRVEEIEGAIDGFTSSATVADAIDEAAAAAKSTIALASGESYLTLSDSTAADGHTAYTLSTTGIDGAISAAVAAVVNGAPAAFDTLKEISDWIQDDQTGAAALAADVASKAGKVSSAVAGNFAGLDANGDLTDSGFKATDFQAAGSYKTTQTAVADPTAAGNAVSFIDSISQNANGEIAVTKKSVQAASSSQAGLMSSSDYNKLAAISATVSNDTLVITTQAAA